MSNYILYHTDTGFIESVLRLTPASKQKMLDNNPGIAFMPGTVADVNKVQMNVSVTPHFIETKPEKVINIPQYVRQQRLTLLKLSDWTQTTDSPLSASKKAEWATYRQALRDMPTNADSWPTVEDITWPSQPS